MERECGRKGMLYFLAWTLEGMSGCVRRMRMPHVPIQPRWDECRYSPRRRRNSASSSATLDSAVSARVSAARRSDRSSYA